MNKNLLIIPDVHGRLFWKQAIDSYPNTETIFLGDYLDPYWNIDGIRREQAFEVFKEILQLAKERNNIHLLLGNHDWHYIHEIDSCRIDRYRFNQIKQLFVENKDLFKLSFEWCNDNKKYLFTHAGVTESWLREINFDIKDLNSENLNNLINTDNGIKYISMISYYRGGYDYFGSLIWADLREHLSSNILINDYYQIFAHSYSKRQIIRDNFAMLDCARAFILTENNEIKKIEEMIDIDKLIAIAIRDRNGRLRDTYRAIKTRITEFKTSKDFKEYNKIAEVNILKKMYDERIENARIYRENNRDDLAIIEEEEADAINNFLPKLPTEDDIIVFLDSKGYFNIEKKDIGRIVKEAKEELLGVDGKMLFNIISERVNK